MPSDADRLRISAIEESSFAGALTSTTLQDWRFTSESLHQEQTTEDSKEIKADRQVSDIVRTKVSGMGSLGLELSYGAHDSILKALLCSTAWSSPVTIGPISTLSAAASDNSFNDSANGLAGLVANQWIKVSGFATAANNGYFKIKTVAAGKITVLGGTLVDESAAAGRKINMGGQIVNGVTKTSFYIEKQYTDLTNEFAGYSGMMPNTGGFDVKADQIITGNVDFLGSREKSLTASAGTGYTSAPTNGVMAGVSDVTAVCLAPAASLAQVVDVSEFSFNINNNLRERLRVGTLGAFSIGAGHFNADGTAIMYFASSALIDYFLSFTEVSVAYGINDAANNGYLIEFPAVKFSQGNRVAGGENTDIMADMKWRAKKSAAEGITCRIARFPAF
jgi:hypothetical protein